MGQNVFYAGGRWSPEPCKYKNRSFCSSEKFKMHIWCFLNWFFLIIWMNSQGQTPSRMIDGVALSGQSMFMLLIWRIPPRLTGEMRTDFTEVERRVASSSTAKTNELPHGWRDYHIIVPLPHIDLDPYIWTRLWHHSVTHSHVLNELFWNLQNNFECSFGWTLIRRN